MTNLKITSTIVLLSSTLLVTACSSHKVQPQQINETTERHEMNNTLYQPVSLESKNLPDEPQVAIIEPIEPIDPIAPLMETSLEPVEMEQPYLIPELPDDTANTRPAKTLFLFGFDQKQLGDEAQSILLQHGKFLAAHPDAKISIHGHTDPQGDPTYNQHLAKQRARYVADLLTQQGVAADQMEIQSWGADAPASSATHHRDNRRVELIYNEEYLVNYQGE